MPLNETITGISFFGNSFERELTKSLLENSSKSRQMRLSRALKSSAGFKSILILYFFLPIFFIWLEADNITGPETPK